jgi:hypothetical protein
MNPFAYFWGDGLCSTARLVGEYGEPSCKRFDYDNTKVLVSGEKESSRPTHERHKFVVGKSTVEDDVRVTLSEDFVFVHHGACTDNVELEFESFRGFNCEVGSFVGNLPSPD